MFKSPPNCPLARNTYYDTTAIELLEKIKWDTYNNTMYVSFSFYKHSPLPPTPLNFQKPSVCVTWMLLAHFSSKLRFLNRLSCCLKTGPWDVILRKLWCIADVFSWLFFEASFGGPKLIAYRSNFEHSKKGQQK